MCITESQLRQIIKEEVQLRLLENIIEEEFDKFLAENEGAEDLQAYKKAKRRDIISKIKKGLIPMALVGGLLGVLGDKTSDHSDIVAATNAAQIQQNVDEANTDEAQLGEFADQLNNTARYMWGVGDQAAMPVPGTKGKITILPASYSLAVRAFLDKKANIERVKNGEEPILRFGELDIDDLPKIADTIEYQGTYEDNVSEFFNTYTGADMVDAIQVLQRVPELKAVSGTGTEEKIIMVNPNKIDPNYVLPELGMTAQDYYNSQYGEFLGDGEKKALEIELPDEVMNITPDSYSGELFDQDFIDATNKQTHRQNKRRGIKESKYTWMNYKNRKKTFDRPSA